MSTILIKDITKKVSNSFTLEPINIEIKSGEFFSLLGPSGCGKTTLLRIISGLLAADSGRIFFDGVDVTALGTAEREAIIVFQNYALWPHLTVKENILFGLEMRKISAVEKAKRIAEIVGVVQLEGLENRFPSELSGGQQQRVALARALIVRPKLLLLDEPLANLDKKLRVELRQKLKEIKQLTGVTIVFVTHDQEEALSLSDRILVMNNGRIEQLGTPAELYHHPASYFVADFLGALAKLPADVAGAESYLRPENFRLTPAAGVHQISATVVSREFYGAYERFQLRTKNGDTFTALLNSKEVGAIGNELQLYIDPKDILVFSEKRTEPNR